MYVYFQTRQLASHKFWHAHNQIIYSTGRAHKNVVDNIKVDVARRRKKRKLDLFGFFLKFVKCGEIENQVVGALVVIFGTILRAKCQPNLSIPYYICSWAQSYSSLTNKQSDYRQRAIKRKPSNMKLLISKMIRTHTKWYNKKCFNLSSMHKYGLLAKKRSTTENHFLSLSFPMWST